LLTSILRSALSWSTTMSLINYPGTPIPTRRPLWQRGALTLVDVWRDWRAARQQRNQLRALQGLSCSTLRDIGLYGQMQPCAPTLSELDVQRGLW
jgi:uncharacterized protein YjiS (DUF1127 family)